MFLKYYSLEEPTPKIKNRIIQPIGPQNNKRITKIIFRKEIISIYPYIYLQYKEEYC